MLLSAAGPFDVRPDQGASGAVFGIVAALMAPRSSGWVRLASSKPSDAPRIHLAHLADADDLERMLHAVTEARRLALNEPVAAITAGTELSPGPAVPTDNRGALAAWVRTAVSTYHHPVGTCAMGADPSLGAVTDSRGSDMGSTVSRSPMPPSCRSSRPRPRTSRRSWWQSTSRGGSETHDPPIAAQIRFLAEALLKRSMKVVDMWAPA